MGSDVKQAGTGAIDPLGRTAIAPASPATRLLHYRLLGLIGQGGMGTVHRAHDERLGREVAIKQVTAAGQDAAAFKERLVREARAVSRLSHPSIVTVHAIEESEGGAFIVMELLDGEPLDARLLRGPLPAEEVVRLGAEVAEALACAHAAGLVHRDIKPANLFLTRRGATKILDFGIAKERSADGKPLTEAGAVLGTWPYMSPEQLRGEPLDGRTDLFALGAVLYEAVSGRRAFPAENVSALVRQITVESPPALTAIPANLWGVIERALQKDAKARFQTGDALAEALRTQGTSVPAKPAVRPEPPEARPTSVAVLTFRDLSPSQDQSYLCDGIAEEVVTSLAQVAGLRVAARSLSRLFNASDSDAQNAGRKLGVATVLEGAVRKSGNKLRVTAQLVDVDSGQERWSQRFDGGAEEVFDIQDQIASAVVRTLKGFMTSGVHQAVRRPETTPAAYDHFLRGRHHYLQQGEIGYGLAERELNAALELDPEYAPAHAMLSLVHCIRADWHGAGDDVKQAAERASMKAVELAPALVETQVARGAVLSMRRDYLGAAQAFEEALRLVPDSYEAHYLYARTCFQLGDDAKAAELFLRGSQINPDEFQCLVLATNALERLHRGDEASAARREALRRLDRILELDPYNERALQLGPPLLARMGERERTVELARRAAAAFPDNTSILANTACAFSVLGMKSEALDCLEKVFGRGIGQLDWIVHDPDYDSLREEPRFKAMLAKLT